MNADALNWRERDTPLVPGAVLGRGEAAHALARRLARLEDSALGRLRGAATETLIIVLGPAIRLPWAEGVEYLGQSAEAPRLYLPTLREPVLPLPLFEGAVFDVRDNTQAPLAVLPDPLCVIELAACRAIDRAYLKRWLERAP